MAAAITFEQAYKSGLHSKNFDVSENIKRGDLRQLADKASDIAQTMHRDPCLSFDDARLMAVQKEMARWGIDPTGMPCDPKAVTFGRRSVAPAAVADFDVEGSILTGGAFPDLPTARPSNKNNFRLPWLRAVFKAFKPWPTWHFMSVLQISCLLVAVLLTLSVLRYLQVYGIGLPSVILEVPPDLDAGSLAGSTAVANFADPAAIVAQTDPGGRGLQQHSVD